MELLKGEAQSLGLTLAAAHLDAFERYYRELAAWNARFNLTAITGYEDVQRKHFLDSLSCVLALPTEELSPGVELPDTAPLQRRLAPLRCADVGSGAGFPGLPLKILMPDIRLTLIESTGKKADFLRHMVELLDLKNVEVLPYRAEDVGHMSEHRECYDVVVARAVAHLCVLAEYCLPLIRLGGRLIAQKGEGAPAEAAAAQPALDELGGVLRHVKAVALPGLSEERYLVVVDKLTKSPEQYPRRPGMPSKRPLC